VQTAQNVIHGLFYGGFIGSLAVAILFLFPLWRSLSRAGFSPYWSLLILIPYLWPVTIFGVVGVLAFGQWPAVMGPAEPTSWSAFSATPWVQVSPEEASRNRHYGLDGFILALYGLVAAGTAMNVFYFFSPNYLKSSQEINGLSPEGAKLFLILVVGWGLTMLCLIPLKRPFVPKLMAAGSWLYMIFFAAIMSVAGSFTAMALYGLIAGTFFAFLFTWYWFKSKRVNVTYLNKIPAS
jgi:hypothetical protein